MISKLLFNKEHAPENSKNRFHEMREKECDDTAGKAHRFVKNIKKYPGIH